MEDRKQRREARKKQQQRQAHGCFLLICLTVFAIGAYIIYIAINPGTIGGLSTLEPNPYAPSDFTAEGAYVTCTAGPTRMGIDVSEHQGKIDWKEVRAAGFDFAFIRIGYRGYSIGEIFTDELARENLAGAKAAGFDVGVYFYAQAISTEEALEEAQWCLEFLSGEALDLPVVYDWEYVSPSARTGSVDRATLTAPRPFDITYRFYQELQQNIALTTYPIPMLILHGEEDGYIRSADIQNFHRINEKSELVIIPGASHRFLEEGAWDMVLDLTRDWFEFEQVLLM